MKPLTELVNWLSFHLSEYQYVFQNKALLCKSRVVRPEVFLDESKNIEKISETMNMNYYQMQHFITESSWSDRELIYQVAKEVSSLLPKHKLTGLIVDESR